MDKTKLQAYLKTEAITEDERQMWLRVGFYVTKSAVAYNEYQNLYKHYYVGITADPWHIPDFVANDLRAAVINWWDTERLQPAKAIDELSDLEVERG